MKEQIDGGAIDISKFEISKVHKLQFVMLGEATHATKMRKKFCMIILPSLDAFIASFAQKRSNFLFLVWKLGRLSNLKQIQAAES